MINCKILRPWSSMYNLILLSSFFTKKIGTFTRDLKDHKKLQARFI